MLYIHSIGVMLFLGLGLGFINSDRIGFGSLSLILCGIFAVFFYKAIQPGYKPIFSWDLIWDRLKKKFRDFFSKKSVKEFFSISDITKHKGKENKNK